MSSPPSSSLVSIAATSSDHLTPLSALPAPNALPIVTTNPNIGRRIPPPCWTNDETLALIHSYRDIYLSLNRGNLRAAHWDDVAASVSARSSSTPGATPKTPVQCRHKIEKLRKRYRSELARSPSSPWIFFPHIHSMETPPPPPPVATAVPIPNGSDSMLKFKIPKAVRSSSSSMTASEPMGEVVRALRALGEGYVRAEQMKMEMAREMERERMQADLRRTEMVLKTQLKIVEVVVGEITKRKKKKARTSGQGMD